MKDTNQQQSFQQLWFNVILPKVEILSIILLVISMVFKILKLQGTAELLMISLSTYAAVCYLHGYQKIELEGKFNALLVKSLGVTSAVLIIGTLFSTLSLAGGTEMVMIGGTSFCILFVVVFFKYLNTENVVLKSLLIRQVKTFIIVAAVFIVTYLLNT